MGVASRRPTRYISMRTTFFSVLTILCLASTASAQIYSEGPIDGNDNAFFVSRPNLPNFLGRPA